jgi:hypothetical protein
MATGTADDVQRAFVDELARLQRRGGRVNAFLQFWCPIAKEFLNRLTGNDLDGFGAGDGIRTRDTQLGRLVLYH